MHCIQLLLLLNRMGSAFIPHITSPTRTLLFAVVCWLGQTPITGLDGATFQHLIADLANNDLGIDRFQSYLDDEAIYTESTINGERLVQSVAASLKHKFSSRINIARSLKKSIEDEHGLFSTTNRFSECCYGPLSEEDFRFKAKVNLNEICVSGEQVNSATRFATDKVKDIMKRNLQANPTIKWQYFASEEGVMTVYPSFRQCNPEYDPRFRPFYVSTATPKAKDIVIVIDTSGSMTTNTSLGADRLTIAIRAAVTVINTLSPNDRVGIVTFDQTPATPPGNTETGSCYSTTLALATHVNKGYLREYVQHLRAVGRTVYSAAFKKAFELIGTAGDVDFDNRTRDKAILFLTDGKPDDGVPTILKAISTENAKLGNTVVIHTYGIGEATEETVKHILESVAHQTDYKASAGEIRAGVFTAVEDVTDLRKTMGSYYNFFSKTGQIPEVHFVVPYFDAFGLGMVTSACLPVYDLSTLVGVTCVDITMSDLLSDVTYFKEGELSYAFMIDNQARLLMHPLLPQPYAVEEDPIFVHMSSLETFDGADEVMQSEIGTKSEVSSLRSISRGDAVYEGVKTTVVSSSYFWHPIEGLGFSVCLVIADLDQQVTVNWNKPYSQPFAYHRLDLKQTAAMTVCNYYGRLGLKDQSTVQFSPQAFITPYLYLSTEETSSTVDSFAMYMTGKTNKNPEPNFKEGVRETVTLTAHFDQLVRDSGQADYIVWRYIGTEDGIFRVFPGSSLAVEYDHTLRSWYQRSVSQKGFLTISTPYLDGLGAGYVVTLSKTLFEGRSSHDHYPEDPIVGVMAMDFSLTYIYKLLQEKFTECRLNSISCMVIERSGFIVAHKDFLDVSANLEVANVHITVKEPAIATFLIEQSAMVKKACINFESFKYQYFWSISIRTGQKIVDDRFEIHTVENTNVFLVKRVVRNRWSDCHCATEGSGFGSCPGVECECPCYEKAHIYDYCLDFYNLSSDSWPPCTPRVPQLDLNSASLQERSQGAGSLKRCFDYDCSSKTLSIDCASSAGCRWCSTTSDGVTLADPYCGMYDKCPFGVVVDNEDGGEDEGNTTIEGIVGIFVGVLVVLIIVGVVLFLYRRRKLRNSATTRRTRGRSSQRTVVSTTQRQGVPVGGSSQGQGAQVGRVASPSPTTGSPDDPPPSYDSLHPTPEVGQAGAYKNRAYSGVPL